MPTYSFHNTKRDIKFDQFMSIEERSEFLTANPHIVQLLSKPFVGDPIRQGVTKLDDDYKGLLKRVKKHNLDSTIEL